MGYWICCVSAFVKVCFTPSPSICILTVATENDTLARIGTSCLQQFLENNAERLSATRWEQVASTFVKLFRTTTPHQLFDETLRLEIDSNSVDLDASGGDLVVALTYADSEQTPLGKQSCLLLFHPQVNTHQVKRSHRLVVVVVHSNKSLSNAFSNCF